MIAGQMMRRMAQQMVSGGLNELHHVKEAEQLKSGGCGTASTSSAGCGRSLARTRLNDRANRGTLHVFSPRFREFSDAILTGRADKRRDFRALELVGGP